MYLISLYICPNQIELHQIIIFDSNNLSISMPHPPFIQSSVGRRKSSLIQERAKRTLVVTSHSNYPKVGSSGGLYTWVLQGCLIRPLLVLLHQRIPVYHYHHLQYMVQWIDCSTRNFRVLGFDMVGHLLHQKSKYSSLRFLFYSQILLRSTLVAENFTSELSKHDKTRFFG